MRVVNVFALAEYRPRRMAAEVLGMSRRPNPTRIDDAQREGTRRRLYSTGILRERADALIAAWDEEALRRDLPPGDRMDRAWEWIEAERQRGRSG